MRSTSDPLGAGTEQDHPLAVRLGARASCDRGRHRPDEPAHAVAGDRRDHEPGVTVGAEVADIGYEVGLRPDDEARPGEQLGAIAGQLVEQHPLLLRRRHAVERGEVDEEAQDPRPLDVAEEPMTEALALARPLDQPGDVGDDELGVVVEAHDAEVRFQRGERVVGDLRLGRRDDADQRALADVGEADEGDVGHQLAARA